jgi:hypothetical protein
VSSSFQLGHGSVIHLPLHTALLDVHIVVWAPIPTFQDAFAFQSPCTATGSHVQPILCGCEEAEVETLSNCTRHSLSPLCTPTSRCPFIRGVMIPILPVATTCRCHFSPAPIGCASDNRESVRLSRRPGTAGTIPLRATSHLTTFSNR